MDPRPGVSPWNAAFTTKIPPSGFHVSTFLDSHFLPGDGFPRLFNAVSDPHTRIENNIPSSPAATAFDPLLLKIITAGNSRNEVIERMESALRRCVVLNVPTNSQMLLNALKLPKFRSEGADSRLVDEFPRELIEPKGMSEFEVVSSLAAFLFARIPRGTSRCFDWRF